MSVMSDSGKAYRHRLAIVLASLSLVVGVCAGVVMFWPVPENPFIARYNELQPGMTYAEVVQILGPPSREFDRGSSEPRIAMWDDGRGLHITVKWVRGGLAGKKVGGGYKEP